MAVSNLTTIFSNFDTTDTTTITQIGGGQGATVDPDIYLQGDQGISRRIDSGTLGWVVSSSDATNRDLSGAGVHLKVWVGSVTWGLVTFIDVVVRSSDGLEDYHRIPTSSYPVTRGGFIPVWVDVSRTPDGGGTSTNATLNTINNIGLYASVGNISSNLKNINLDAATYGTAGYAMTGTTNIAEVNTAEENTSTGLKGVLTSVEGVYFCFSRLIVGASDAAASTPVATTYSDTGISIVFPDQTTVSSTYMGKTISLGNASTTYTLVSGTIQSSNISSATNRPDFIVTGTNGSLTLTDCNILGMRLIDFTSACTINGGVIDSVEITQGSSDIGGTEIRTRSASQVAVIDDPTFGTTTGLNNVDFKQVGSGHAIEITTPGSYTFTNITFADYGGTVGSNLTTDTGANDAAILNSSGGLVTINVSGGNSPSVRNVTNTTASTTEVVASANFIIKNIEPDSEVRIYRISDGLELGGVEKAGVSSPQNSTILQDTTEFGTISDPKYTLTYVYNQSDAPFNVNVVAMNFNYQHLRQTLTLDSDGVEVPIFQIQDRNYINL